MNNTRRKVIARIAGTLEDAKQDLEGIRDEEQEYLDNMPENLVNSERYSNAESVVSNMDDAINSLEDALGCMETIDE